MSRPSTAVAIPACNEADRIAACLEAIDAQVGAQVDHIVLLANNCMDGTADIARAVPIQPGTMLHVIEQRLFGARASAGHARRLAMELAVTLAGPGGIVLTTDADGRVDPDWLAANLAAIAAGADAVAGWVELDAIEWGRIPTRLHEDDARECAYDQLCDAIHAALDPDPADPMPRHTQHSGASIAVTVAAYERCGGVPDIASGEDRALIAALRRVDAGIRHAPEVHVTVSGRIEGRSEGGMADTIRRRLSQPDRYIDDRLEPALECARRARCRHALRRVFETGQGVAAFADLVGLPSQRVRALLEAGFGAAWDAMEAESLPLRRRLVAVADLAAQTAAASAILAALHPAGQLGSPLLAAQTPS